MTTKKHISVVSAERFEAAISESLVELIRRDQIFSVSDVVRNASYEDGSNVGETTIYSKGTDGNRVHDRLLVKIKEASAQSRSAERRKRVAKFDEKDRVALVSSAIQKQVIEQECQIQELEASLSALSLQVRQGQEEQFIALAAVNLMTKGVVLGVVRPLRNLEGKLGDRDLIRKLRSDAAALVKQFRRIAPPN